MTEMDHPSTGNELDRLCENACWPDKGFIMENMGDGDKVEIHGKKVGAE